MKSTLTSYWQNLQARERRIITVGGSLLALALLYAYLWLPLQQQRQKLHALLPKLRVQAAQLQTAQKEVQQLKTQAGAVPASTTPLRQLLENSVNSLGIKPKQIDMTGENSALLVIDSVSFDTWLRCLHTLQTQYGLRLVVGEMQSVGSGLVKVQATVSPQ
jgi:general secretion pathway protein M